MEEANWLEHEVRGTMNAMKLASWALSLMADLSLAEKVEYLRAIERACDRMDGLMIELARDAEGEGGTG